MKHTKGEWRIFDNEAGDITLQSDDGELLGCIWDNDNEDEMRANAKIIKAAPDMIEALLFMAVQMQKETTVIMLSAIEKATGMTYKEIKAYIEVKANKENN